MKVTTANRTVNGVGLPGSSHSTVHPVGAIIDWTWLLIMERTVSGGTDANAAYNLNGVATGFGVPPNIEAEKNRNASNLRMPTDRCTVIEMRCASF